MLHQSTLVISRSALDYLEKRLNPDGTENELFLQPKKEYEASATPAAEEAPRAASA